MSPSHLGILGAGGTLVYLPFSILMGYLSDRLGREIFLRLAPLFLFTGTIILILGKNFSVLLFSTFILGWGASFFWPVIAPLLVEKEMGRMRYTLSIYNVSWALPMLVSSPLGGILFSRSPSLPFVVSGIIALSIFFILNFTLTRFGKREEVREVGEEREKGALFPFFLLILFLSNAFLSILFNIFPKWGVAMKFSPRLLGFILGSNSFFRLLAFFLYGRGIYPRHYLTPSFLALSFSSISLVFFLSRSILLFFISSSLLGVAGGYTYSLALHQGVGERKERGRRAGMIEGTGGGGWITGSLVGGWVMEKLGYPYPFLIFSLLSLFIFLLTLFILHKRIINGKNREY